MQDILKNVIDSCNYVKENSQHVKINYDKLDEIIKTMDLSENKHWLSSNPFGILDLPQKEVMKFLLYLHTIGDYCFWGDPKWEIEADGKVLDGSFAIIYLIAKRLKSGKDFNMSKEEFKEYLKGNVEIPMLESRYENLKEVNKYLERHDFYEEIKDYTKDIDLLNYIIKTFSFFKDESEYKGKTIYFYKRAQLFASDILVIRKQQEKIKTDYSNIIGCADYKIPQVMRCYDILEFDKELASIVDNKKEVEKDSEYEVEIRANNIVVIDYIAKKKNYEYTRKDINDFIWLLGQDKSKMTKSYHRTLTDKY